MTLNDAIREIAKVRDRILLVPGEMGQTMQKIKINR